MGRKRKQKGWKVAARKGWKVGDIVHVYTTPDDGTGFRPGTAGLIIGEKWQGLRREYCYFEVMIENGGETVIGVYPPIMLYPPEE